MAARLTEGLTGRQRARMELTDKDESGLSARHRQRRRAVLVAVGVVALGVAFTAWLQPPEAWGRAKDLVAQGMAWVRALGPGWYFTAFATLPAVGFPVSAFALSAGPLFAPVIGLPAVLGLAGLCMGASMTISYGLSRYLMRPWVERLLSYLGYKIPQIPVSKRRMVVFLVRATPGPPYVFQSFLLGLAEVPFLVYLSISWITMTANVSLFIVFGDALMKGHVKVALGALAGLVFVVCVIKAVRRWGFGRARVAAGRAVGVEVNEGESP